MMLARKARHTLLGIASTILIGLSTYSFNSSTAHAQEPDSIDPCNSFVQTADALLRNADSTDPEVLQAMATTAEQGRLCYGEKRIGRVIWLLRNEKKITYKAFG